MELLAKYNALYGSYVKKNNTKNFLAIENSIGRFLKLNHKQICRVIIIIIQLNILKNLININTLLYP